MQPNPAPKPFDPRPADPFDALPAKLESVDQLPMAEQVTVFAEIHAVLNEALSTTSSSAPAGPAVQQQRPGGPGGFRPGGR